MPDTASPTADDKKKKKDTHPRDPGREVVETIVFVVVLVLLLKLFVTEAFVIPTGSMAETLYGYQKIVACPKCGHEFPVNSHDEVEPDPNGRMKDLVGFCCPNCRYSGRFQPKADRTLDSPPNRTGDRVLVLKPLYHLRKPERGDVVVFKFPQEPQQKHTAQNYIKRAMGFGGETIAIFRGDLYVSRTPQYPREEGVEEVDLWKPGHMFTNNEDALKLFEASRKAGFTDQVQGGFQIVRKTDDQVLACRRIVWDNDKQPKDLPAGSPPRWAPEAEGKWKGDDARQPKVFDHVGDGDDWLRYQHLLWNWENRGEPGAKVDPQPVDNFLGYNAGLERDRENGSEGHRPGGDRGQWVGDLVLECDAELGDGAEVTLELSKGVNRFRAKFAGGAVALSRTWPDGKVDELASRPCKVTGKGKYHLRFANVDSRLRVWVNGKAIGFGTDADYTPAEPKEYDPHDVQREGWTTENDVTAPARIGAKGAAKVHGLKLYRDIYYTHNSGNDQATTYYVQPGHYLCLGDNSSASSDSRTWGTVPERLMLGKAVFVFWPFSTHTATNRIGFIK
jgi:signal peptidase I